MDKEYLPGLVLFVLACMFLAFLVGVLVAIFRVTPYATIKAAVSNVAMIISESRNDSTLKDLHFAYKARNDDSGVTVLKDDQVQPGVTLVTGIWKVNDTWGPEIRIIDLAGKTLHSWKIHPEKIWPDSPHQDWARNSHNKPHGYVHGTALLPDGDIIFNIEYLTTVRMDACGNIKWKLPMRNHHSVFEDDDGNFWVSGLIWREKAIDRFPHLKPPFVDETLVKLSPDGEVLREISILDVLYNSGYQATVDMNENIYDVTHMNDVEILSNDLADKFPMFNAGDILVSLRKYSMVLVIDGESEQVKWHFRHPLIQQHDPDFEPDGRIVIFDNNDDTTRDGSLWGATQILSVDPVNKTYERLYPTSPDQKLYTKEGGKHQLLANGNRLITEANAGRLLEVTPAGELVWNWVIESREGGYIPEVLEGSRYPLKSVDFTSTLSCR